jgi:hypothetical protein
MPRGIGCPPDGDELENLIAVQFDKSNMEITLLETSFTAREMPPAEGRGSLPA